MLRAAVGHSDDPDSLDAIAEVIAQCQDTLSGAVPQVGLLFAAIDFDHEAILAHLQTVFPGLQVIGGTTDGEMSSVLAFQQDSITLMLLSSDTVEMGIGVGYNASQDPKTAAQSAIAQAQTQLTQPPQCCLTFPEGIKASPGILLEQLQQALGTTSIPIVGGLASTHRQTTETYQFYQTQVLQNAVPVLLLAGDLVVAHGIGSGWQPLGRRSQITRAQGTIVYEIEHQTALSYYQDYLGGLNPSGEYPLVVFNAQGGDLAYVRAPAYYDARTQTVSFFSEVPEQAWVQIAQTSREEILQAVESSIDQALAQYPDGASPALALFFSCAGRRWLLGTRTQEEYVQVQQLLPQHLPSCGFYGNGEIAPLLSQQTAQLHNQTFVTLLLGTKPAKPSPNHPL
ncbi:MAG: FIST N-terminal domain-containing protein [Cyanobacteria bacterium P01_G01_bin.54]